jgi:hypothetical protein
MRVLLLLALGSAPTIAQEHAHHHDALPPGDAQIVISINPEARVSAALAAPLPAPGACGSVTELKIKVINNGFITAPLRASIVGDNAPVISLHMDSANLSGQAEEARTLHLTPLGPDLIDVTIAFNIDKNIGDLGGRDRVHLLLNCKSQALEDRRGSRS